MDDSPTYTSFEDHRCIATGSLAVNALAVRQAGLRDSHGILLTFDDQTGATVEIDLRGSKEELLARISQTQPVNISSENENKELIPEPKGRGRPKLGVVAREVTLLPRHWQWLESQPGGASVTLRKLVEEARRTNADKDQQRQIQERIYRFMQTLAGNLPNFEEASRALFANDRVALNTIIQTWPVDVHQYIDKLSS